ncbi:hypothetical protein AYI68_g6029 [Smittium mucronatum]|uniref:Uncharacterized protein n=1 Tax=Smittium mucronatum TaxID=133383 RepID=A0A1R0GSK1_9FUNG|nr:hypothetical protein AYI68_g6029 [Smittium mucronatum]
MGSEKSTDGRSFSINWQAIIEEFKKISAGFSIKHFIIIEKICDLARFQTLETHENFVEGRNYMMKT